MARRVLGDDPFAKPAAIPAKPAAKPGAKKKPVARKKKPAVQASEPAVQPPEPAVQPPVSAPRALVSAPQPLVPALQPLVPAPQPLVLAPLEPAVLASEPLRVNFAPADPEVQSEVAALAARVETLRQAAAVDPSQRAALEALVTQIGDLAQEVTTEAGSADGDEAQTAEDGVEAGGPEEAAEATARELLSSEFYLRQWGRVALRDRAQRVDDFGYDPEVAARWEGFLDFVYDRWLRVEVEGIHHVPSDGRVILVANHGGAIPVDGVVLATALRKEHPKARHLRWLAEDFVFHFPYAGTWLNRLGAVRACPDNAERLLQQGFCVGLFPEGVKGISKGWRERYKLQRFGRGGHIKLALRTRSPIIPVTIVGSDEAHPMLGQSPVLAKFLGLPYMPITPTFPWLGPLGLMPLPTRWRIVFGEALPMDGYDPVQADDEVLVGRLNERLRSTIQETLDRTLRARSGR